MSPVLGVHFWQQQLEAATELTPPPLPGGAVDLAHAARLCLQWLLRRGPQEAHARAAVATLLRRTAAAVSKGWVPCWLPWRLRQDLRDLAAACRAAKYHHPHQPLWWEPLPYSDGQPDWWQHTDRVLTTSWQAALARDGAEPWYHLPQLLPTEPWRFLGEQLEQRYRHDLMALQPAGVGSQGTLTTVRSDAVLYLDGTEAWLWRHLPALGALITWSRARLPILLTDMLASPQQPLRLVAPQRAMLARYPAPSSGYARHLDNPGGSTDNGRAWTLVMYLGQPTVNRGGEIVLYDMDGDQPRLERAPADRDAVLFNARQVPHRVNPIATGPARWALSIWFTDHQQASNPFVDMVLPRLTAEQVTAAWDQPQPPPDRLLLHQLTEQDTRVQVVAPKGNGRLGIVNTVYAAGDWLAAWCDYHLQHKVSHLVLVFDRADLPQEADTMARLSQRFKDQPVTLWSAEQARAYWQQLPETAFVRQLRPLAALGTRTSAICARQSLNAGAVLHALRQGQLPPVDWLAHLDADEYLHFGGSGRGGAHAQEHVAALAASGWHQVRYLNHELLLRETPGPVRFKCHPRIAQRKLGSAGWQALKHSLGFGGDSPVAQRHYFAGYLNGKGAVAVSAGRMGAVHGWIDSHGEAPIWLDGPHILHAHNPSAAAFNAKMRRRYSSGDDHALDEALFHPGALDREAKAQLLANPDTDLTQLYRQRTVFDQATCNMLADAGLLITPPTAVGDMGST